jgi:hypothetical protein
VEKAVKTPKMPPFPRNIPSILRAIASNLGHEVRVAVLAWADREQAKADERRRALEGEAREAEDWLIRQVTEGQCVHEPGMTAAPLRWVYCDECPLGEWDGELTEGAQQMLCSRSRHYSK